MKEQYRLVRRRVGESDRAAVPLGKVNVELTPNPFAEGCEYTQELDVYDGVERIDARGSGVHMQLDVLVDKQEDVLVVSGAATCL